MSSYSVRMIQARCAALGFWPGPIDGITGPRTRAAESAARAAQAKKGLPFIHKSGISMVRWHWTAGHHKANATDRKAYHIAIEGDGTILRLHDHAKLLAHTLNANTGAVGISLCAMALAEERPFKQGPSPITPKQISELARETARLCKQYDIPVSPWSTQSHAEVQPTLGIKQKNKWDITWVPGMTAPGDPMTVGNCLRDLVRGELLNL